MHLISKVSDDFLLLLYKPSSGTDSLSKHIRGCQNITTKSRNLDERMEKSFTLTSVSLNLNSNSCTKRVPSLNSGSGPVQEDDFGPGPAPDWIRVRVWKDPQFPIVYQFQINLKNDHI